MDAAAVVCSTTLITLSTTIPSLSHHLITKLSPRITLPPESLLSFQHLIQRFRDQLIESRSSREYYLNVILSSRCDDESGSSSSSSDNSSASSQVVMARGRMVDDDIVLQYFSSFFPEITLVDRCSNGGWTEATRIPICAPTVIINRKKRTKGLISILASIPIACSALSNRPKRDRTSSVSPTIPSLTLPQLHFLVLALLAHSVLRDLNQHVFGTPLNQSKNTICVEDSDEGSVWLLDLMRNQQKVAWDARGEECLEEMRKDCAGTVKIDRTKSKAEGQGAVRFCSMDNNCTAIAKAAVVTASSSAAIGLPVLARSHSHSIESTTQPAIKPRPSLISLDNYIFPSITAKPSSIEPPSAALDPAADEIATSSKRSKTDSPSGSRRSSTTSNSSTVVAPAIIEETLRISVSTLLTTHQSCSTSSVLSLGSRRSSTTSLPSSATPRRSSFIARSGEGSPDGRSRRNSGTALLKSRSREDMLAPETNGSSSSLLVNTVKANEVEADRLAGVVRRDINLAKFKDHPDTTPTASTSTAGIIALLPVPKLRRNSKKLSSSNEEG